MSPTSAGAAVPSLKPPIDWRPLGSQTESLMTAHDIVCLHTMVGYLYSTDSMFKQNGYGGTESHFGVGGVWGSDASRRLDGVIYQWQELSRTADANLNGNYRVISIETADNAPRFPADILAWTAAQVDSISRLVAWLCSKQAHASCPPSWKCHNEGIPAVLIPDSKPGRRGIAYHQQGCDPYRVSGGELWSGAYGKECPGPVRTRQISSTIIPRVQQLLAPAPAPEDEVTPQDKVDIIAGVVAALGKQAPDPGSSLISYRKPDDPAQWLDLGTHRRYVTRTQAVAITTAAAQASRPDPRLVVVLDPSDPFWLLPVFDPAAPPA